MRQPVLFPVCCQNQGNTDWAKLELTGTTCLTLLLGGYGPFTRGSGINNFSSHNDPIPLSRLTIMNDSLTAIVSIINTSVQKLQSAYAQKGLTVPNLDEPYSPGYPDDAQTREAILLINAAATQLIATVKSPVDTILELAPNMYVPALLGFVVDANIPEILNEAPDKVSFPILYLRTCCTKFH